MNDVLITFGLLIFVFIWRGITSFNCSQRCLHCLGILAPLLQWYTLLFVGLGVTLGRTAYDIVKFEYIKYDFLTLDNVLEEKGFIPGLTEEEKEELTISPWLRVFSLVAPAFGVMAAIVVALHVWAVVRASAVRKMQDNDRLRWSTGWEMNMVLLVIAMPIVFINMAMRAEVRIWTVMTGSAWIPYQNVFPPVTTWEKQKTLEMAMYTSDLELAGFFQYLTIWNFGVLCMHYLQRAPPEYRWALRWAGLQGVYLYVIFGMARSVLNLAVAIFRENPNYGFIVSTMQDKVLTAVGPVFSVATILCVYNMFIVTQMSDVKGVLGNANLKFQATRLLVLLAQIQLQVLMGLTVGSGLYQAAEKYLPDRFQGYVQSWHLSTYRAKLMHAALLNVECLIVAVMNRCFWPPSGVFDHCERDGHAAHATEGKLSAAGAGELKEPFLVQVDA